MSERAIGRGRDRAGQHADQTAVDQSHRQPVQHGLTLAWRFEDDGELGASVGERAAVDRLPSPGAASSCCSSVTISLRSSTSAGTQLALFRIEKATLRCSGSLK